MHYATVTMSTYMKRLVFATGAALAILAGVFAASSQAYRTEGTSALEVYTEPHLSAPGIATLRDYTTITIVCQTRGDNVVPGRPSTMWDKISSPYSGFVSDWYTSTPVTDNPSPGLPACNTPPAGTSYVSPWYALERSGSHQCLDDSNYSQALGNQIQIWACIFNGNQHWRWLDSVTGVSLLQNETSGQCLDVSGLSSANFTPAVQWACNYGDPAQGFDAWWPSTAGFSIQNTTTRTCLDDPYSNASSGVKLEFYHCNATPAQIWNEYELPA